MGSEESNQKCTTILSNQTNDKTYFWILHFLAFASFATCFCVIYNLSFFVIFFFVWLYIWIEQQLNSFLCVCVSSKSNMLSLKFGCFIVLKEEKLRSSMHLIELLFEERNWCRNKFYQEIFSQNKNTYKNWRFVLCVT